MKSAPVITVKGKINDLPEDPRNLLEKLLKLFAQVGVGAAVVLQHIAYVRTCVVV